jgi:OPT family oligopeptide transporter
MKVPQRVTFWAQFVATLWSCIVQIAVLNWALGSIENVCSPDQSNNYVCPNAHVFFTASIIWGVIGPNRIFGPSGIYHPMIYFFLLGLGLPILVYVLAKKFPKSPLRYVNTAIIFGGTAYIPPATPLTYCTWSFVGTIFNKIIKGRHLGWWTEYNYITSAALDSGTIICVLLIFFALQLPQVASPAWWGGFNGGFMDNGDWNAVVQKVVVNGTFGPTKWV